MQGGRDLMLTSLVSELPVISPAEAVFPAERTLCITGHREKSIIPYHDLPIYRELTASAVKLMLCRYIDMAAERGYEWFISGLATGTDLWAAEYIIEKKRLNSRIKLVGAMPYLRHADHFSAAQRKLLEKVEKNCDCLVSVNQDPQAVYNKGPGRNLYRDRNYFMVDRSSAVIAFLDDKQSWSGTRQTVNYGYRTGRLIKSFSLDDVYRIIDESSADIREISRNIAFLENVFDLPY